MSMEIKRCLLTKTTNDYTFAIYPKTSADLVVLDQNTEEKLIDRLNNNGIWQNKTFYQGKMIPKGTIGAGDESINIASIGGSWWAQTKGHNYGTAPSLIIHQRRLIEQKDSNGDRTVSPTIRLQNYITYNHDGNPTTNNGVVTYTGEQMCRVTSALHETIADGEAWSSSDTYTPNFTPVAIISYNKFKGPVGMNAIFGRVKDVYYTDEELNGNSASKSCAGGFYVTRLSNYSQGKNGTSYSIGIETWTDNQAQEDGLFGTQGYYGASDMFSYKTWTCGYHLIGGGRRPITAGILINGSTASANVYQIGTDENNDPIYTDLNDVNGNPLYTGTTPSYISKTLKNGMYNAIVIGGTSMAIAGKNSPNTVGINMASWSQSKFYGYAAIRIGYAPRFLTGRGPAYFEAPSFKFLNSNGDMPIGITAKEGKSPYILFKTGATKEERPNDIIRSKIAYYCASSDPTNITNNYLTISSDNDIRFATKCAFGQNNIITDDDDQTINIYEKQDFDDAAVYKFKNDKFFGTLSNREKVSNKYISSYNQNLRNRSYPVLGTEEYLWQTAFLKESPWVIADENVFDKYPSGEGKLSESSIIKWGNIPMDECLYFRNDTESQHNTASSNRKIIFALTEQKITEAGAGIAGKGYLRRVYDIGGKSGQYENEVDKNSIYAIDYNQCFVIEGAYNRYKHKKHDESIESITTDITNIKQQVYEDSNSNIDTKLINRVKQLEIEIAAINNIINNNSEQDENDINNIIDNKLAEFRTSLYNDNDLQSIIDARIQEYINSNG